MKNIFIVLFVLAFSGASATQHFIHIGEAFSLKVSLNDNLNVLVGDTITWQGDMAVYNLSSVSVPEGATSFYINDGNSFSYVIFLAGDYEYKYAADESGSVEQTIVASFPPVESLTILSNFMGSLKVISENGRNILYSISNNPNPIPMTVGIYDEGGRMRSSVPVTLTSAGYILPQTDRGIYFVMAVNGNGEVYSAEIWQP
jgi:hypothetical protein